MSTWEQFKSYIIHKILAFVLVAGGIFLLLYGAMSQGKGVYGGSQFTESLGTFYMIVGGLLLIPGIIVLIYFKFKWHHHR